MDILNIAAELKGNPYPGRGIVLGRSADNRKAIVAYFIMGRSENSRNRIFSLTEDGIRTEAHDPAKMVDPSLIIYHPVRSVTAECGNTTVVTNGDQTDTIRDYLLEGKSWQEALDTREFEPDAPNYTPRISGVVCPSGGYMLSILKSAYGDPACCQRFYFTYDRPLAGEGHFIHTYRSDGNPLPSYEGEPKRVALPAATAAELADLLWENLNADNKVSLFVQYLDLESGEAKTVLKNKHQGD